MTTYLDRLKQLEDEKFSLHTPDMELTKLTKGAYGGFVSTGAGHIVKNLSEPETLQDRQREARRRKVIKMLDAAPNTQRAIFVDDASDPHNIILAVAVRHPTPATCEMLIPKAKYDSWQLLELIERHGQTTH